MKILARNKCWAEAQCAEQAAAAVSCRDWKRQSAPRCGVSGLWGETGGAVCLRVETPACVQALDLSWQENLQTDRGASSEVGLAVWSVPGMCTSYSAFLDLLYEMVLKLNGVGVECVSS